MTKPRWHTRFAYLISSALIGLLTSWSVFASTLTVRDISLKDEGRVEILFDSPVNKKSLEVEFVRDIIQFTLKNATIYPAKIIHAKESNAVGFTKLFAYQYSPEFIRIRLSVDGNANDFKKSVTWSGKGKSLVIRVPALKEKTGLSPEKEQSLLSKVLGNSKAEGVKEEKTAAAKEEKKEEKVEKSLGKKKNSTPEVSQETLGGAKTGPSVFRSFMAMFLVVGGLGMLLLYLKHKKGSTQAKRVGDSWLGGILGGTKNKKALIEVISSQPIGPKQSITVIRIRDQQFVLGVSQDHVQLITQLDSDDTGSDVLDDPKVVDSLGKMFGAQPSFQSMLKGSDGANAVIGRSAYQAQGASAAPSAPIATIPASPGLSARDKIRQRLNGMGARS